MIDKATVEHLAKLARIELTSEEVTRLEADLQKILNYVEELQKVPTDGLPEIAQVTGLKNILRSDKNPQELQATPEELLKAAPATENGYVKVKAIFD